MKRHSRKHPCPVCGGFDGAPRGQGIRCFGFLSEDGRYAHCTREETAGDAPYHENSQTWAHRLDGPYSCGVEHSPASAPARSIPSGPYPRSRIVATYDYRDERGEILFQVVRKEPKGFRQRRPDGNGGWIWKLDGVRRVPYRLPELLESRDGVYIVEGEKDADRLGSIGLTATTNPGGQGKWRDEYADPLRGRHICIIPDADRPGREHAQAVARSLHGKAASVRVLELPWRDGARGKDVSDWLDAGRTVGELRTLAREAPEWEPPVEKAVAARSARDRSAPRKPRVSVPERYEGFPVNALPKPLSLFVTEGARALGCDPALLALPLLSGLAAAVGNTRRVRLKRDWAEPCVLWTATVADSGTLKSPAHEKALAPLQDRQGKALQEHADAAQRYERERLRYEADLAAWKRAKGRRENEEAPESPREPTATRFSCADVTVEALAVILAANPRGILLARDELSGWFGSFDLYKTRGGADVAAWLQMHRAGHLTVDRKTGDKRTLHVPKAAVSVCGNIQPGTLARALGQEHFDNGLAARFLVAMPPRRPRVWSEAETAAETQRGLRKVYDGLFALGFTEGSDAELVDLPLTAEGKAKWVSFYNAHGREQEQLTGDDAAAWSKLEGYAARLALLIHLARAAAGEAVDPGAVDAESVRAGVALAEWFKGETRRVYAVLGESPEKRRCRELVELVRAKGGRISVRDLMRSSRKHAGSADDAQDALDRLAEAGLGRWEQVGPSPKGGRPSQVFVLTAPDDADNDKTPEGPAETPRAEVLSMSIAQETGEREAPPAGRDDRSVREVVSI